MAKIGDLQKIDMTKKDDAEEGDEAGGEDESLENQLGLDG